MKAFQVLIAGSGICLLSGCASMPEYESEKKSICTIKTGCYLSTTEEHIMKISETKIELFYISQPEFPYAVVPHSIGHVKNTICVGECMYGGRFLFEDMGEGEIRVGKTATSTQIGEPLIFKKR